MINFFEAYSEYYFLVFVLQGICAFHSINRGTQSKWIWIIVFLPLIGSLAYLFSEVIRKRHVNDLQSTVGSLINPTGRISQLEKQFEFTDTFANRVALADAYLANGQYDKAINLYEPALQGIFDDNEHVIKQLIVAYYHKNRFEDIVRIAPKVTSAIDFTKSAASQYYAFALEQTGNYLPAENQYKAMNHRYSNYEARYLYGDFLQRQNRSEDARNVFYEIFKESQQLSRREKNNSGIWINKAKESLSQLEAVS